jgi:hypothetical protein
MDTEKEIEKDIETPTKNLSILSDIITDEPESSEELMKPSIANCASPTNFESIE